MRGGTVYEDEDFETFHGRRLLAIDGSKIYLPASADIENHFGGFDFANPKVTGRHCAAMASVLYDLLNRVCVDATLAHSRSYEGDLAVAHLEAVRPGDLVVYDRGYCSFKIASRTIAAGADFLIRAHEQGFSTARDMLAGNGADDQIVDISPTRTAKSEGFTDAITIRFVRVALDTGETEVLMTSLLDTDAFPVDAFKDLYWKRWGVETFYGILKGRLDLENFSGKTAESVLQDFHASVFLTGVEAVFTAGANEQLAQRPTLNPQQVNKAVAFHAIKERTFELLLSRRSIDGIVQELDKVFMTNPVSVRPGRNPPRTRNTGLKRLGFWKRRRKATY